MAKEEKEKILRALKEKMLKDEKLPLKKQASNLVFGEGSADADILFLGEAPGYWEDIKGRPFVGNAGALLNQLLQSIKLQREEVFITNVICFRPPDNRDPLPEEITAFAPYVDEIIKTIDPKMIVTLGRFSMAKFIPGAKITAVHGEPHSVDWKGRKLTIIPMFHPAAALRSGEVLRLEKEDFLKLPAVIKEAEKTVATQMNLI
jgi:DNA polymerase